jgi:hypothetical protein
LINQTSYVFRDQVRLDALLPSSTLAAALAESSSTFASVVGDEAKRIGVGAFLGRAFLELRTLRSHLWTKRPGHASRRKAGRPSMQESGCGREMSSNWMVSLLMKSMHQRSEAPVGVSSCPSCRISRKKR